MVPCMGWDVTDFGIGALFWTPGMAGTAGPCFIWGASVAGAGDVGCMHGAEEVMQVVPL